MSVALHLSRLCIFENDFERHIAGMKRWFAKRDYPQDLISSDMNKVKFRYVENKYKNNKEKEIPFVVTFHPLLRSLGSILNKNYYLLQMNDEVKKAFSLRAMVSFRSARKLSSYLVQAKLYPAERKIGSCKCNGNRCEVCQSISEIDTFT